MLTVDQDSDDFKFFKTLNEDVKLQSDEYNRWDIQFENQDYVNITGKDSLVNAICIAIMTRFNELDFMKILVAVHMNLLKLINLTWLSIKLNYLLLKF